MMSEGGVDLESQNEDRAQKEIRSLLWMKEKETDAVYKEALEDWEKKAKLFSSRVERKEKQRGALKNEIYNLIGFYSVFQGVVLTAVSQSEPTVLQCRKFWIPVVLSGLASVVTLVGIVQKLKEIEVLKTTIQEDTCSLKDLEVRETDLRDKRAEFKFGDFPQKVHFKERKRRQSEEGARACSILFVRLTLAIFALAFPVCHWFLLCK